MKVIVISGGKKYKVSLTTYLASELNRLTRMEKDIREIKQLLKKSLDNLEDCDSGSSDDSSECAKTEFKPGYFVLP